MRVIAVARDHRVQVTGDLPPPPVLVEADGCEPGTHLLGRRTVVAADQRHLLRERHAAVTENLEGHNRLLVVERVDAGGAFGAAELGGERALDRVPPHGDGHGSERDAVLAGGGGGAGHPLLDESAYIGVVGHERKYATVAAGGKLSLVPLAGGESKVIGKIDPDEAVIRWSNDGRYIYLRQLVKPYSMKISRMDVSTGRKENWKELQPPDPVGVRMIDVALTPDGSSYAYSFQRDIVTLFLVGNLK